MKLFKWLCREVFSILGGMCIGFSVPIGIQVFPFPDFYVFMPMGVLLLGLSYYYKFVDKE
jgi:hypothetical protein